MKKTLIGLAAAFTLAVSAGSAIAGYAQDTFSGLNNHVVTGHYSIKKQSDGSHILTLADDFVLDGAPDPSVGFGKDGHYSKGVYLKSLSKHKGTNL